MITLFLTCRKVSCCSSGSFGLKCWLLMFGVACMNFGPIRCFPLLCELLHSTIYMCDFKNRLKTVRWVFSKCSHKVLNAGVKLPSTLLPLRAKQHAPWGLTPLSKLRVVLWLEPSMSAAFISLPNNTTCSTTAEHSFQLDAWSCYSFIMSPGY